MQRFLLLQKRKLGTKEGCDFVQGHVTPSPGLLAPSSRCFSVLQLSVIVFLFILLIMGQFFSPRLTRRKEKRTTQEAMFTKSPLILHAKQCTLAPTPPGSRPALQAVCSFPVGTGRKPHSSLVLALMKRHLQTIRARFRHSEGPGKNAEH